RSSSSNFAISSSRARSAACRKRACRGRRRNRTRKTCRRRRLRPQRPAGAAMRSIPPRIRMRPARRTRSARSISPAERPSWVQMRASRQSAPPAGAAPLRRSISQPWGRQAARCRGHARPTPRPAAGGALATLAPSQTPRDEYDLAYGYVLRKDYALAEDAFHSFLSKYPNDRLAGDATYWLGESMFQRRRFRDAAEAFLNVSTKYES